MPEVQRIFEESHGSYGADMIALKLKQEGNGADPATIRSIMEELNIESNRNTASRKYQRMRRQLANRLRKHEFSTVRFVRHLHIVLRFSS